MFGVRTIAHAIQYVQGLLAIAFCFLCAPARTAGPAGQEVKPAVLQKKEGDARTRRPREGVPLASAEF